MNKVKILLIFILLLTVPSYFLLKNRDFNLPSLNIQKSDKENHTEMNKEMKITEKELENTITKSTGLVENLKINFENSKVTASGTVKPSQNFETSIIPKVEDEKLKLELSNLKIGSTNPPQILLNQIQGAINKTVDKNINSKHKIKSVIIKEEELILIIK